jgi:WD40 repeat protein
VSRLANGRPIGKPIGGHGRGVTALAVGVLPDGTPVIVSGSGDGTVWVRQLTDGTELAPPLDLPGRVDSVAIHGDIIVTASSGGMAVHRLVIRQPTR